MKTINAAGSYGKSVRRVLAVTAVILMVPLVAMRFYNGVNWTVLDFVVAGVLLLTTGLVYEFAVRRVAGKNRRRAAGIGLMIIFAYVWAELAVGVFTNLGS